MTGRQKVLLAALAVLLVALYLVAVGAGRHDRGDPAAGPGWLSRLGRPGGTVDPAAVDADCPAADAPPGVLRFVGDCRLRVAAPGRLRTLVLRSPGPFGVTAPAPGDTEVTVSDEVTPGDGGDAVAKIAVDRPTEVVLHCPGGVGCTVTVARS